MKLAVARRGKAGETLELNSDEVYGQGRVKNQSLGAVGVWHSTTR